MDNGLIFPYRQKHAHDEAHDANHPKHHHLTLRGEGCVRSVGPECVVVKRWGDAGR
jgi:hypothetical protein